MSVKEKTDKGKSRERCDMWVGCVVPDKALGTITKLTSSEGGFHCDNIWISGTHIY